MSWLIFAILTAVCESLKDLFSKLGLQGLNEYLIAWASVIFALPILTVALVITGVPPIGEEYLRALLIHGTVNTCAIILYMRAVKSSELSVTIPMITFSPLFLLVTSPILVGEHPSSVGLVGVVAIVCGSYLLHIREVRSGVLAPFKALGRKPGPRYMLFVAFLWSITANYDKIGIQSSSPFFWAFSLAVFMSISMFPFACGTNRQIASVAGENIRKLAPIGFFYGATMVFQMIALNLTLVAYVISIKRASVALAVLWGGVFLKEKNVKDKLVGVIAMLVGVVLIALG